MAKSGNGGKGKKNDNNTNSKNLNANIDINKKIDELKIFLQQCRRVIIITRKPTRDEYLTVSKITGLGICLLGAIGYVIHVPIMYLKGMLKS